LALCRRGRHRKLVTRFGVIRRVYWKVWFWFGFQFSKLCKSFVPPKVFSNLS